MKNLKDLIEAFNISLLRISGHLRVAKDTLARFLKFNSPEGATEDRLPAKVKTQLNAFATAVAEEDEAYRIAAASDLTEAISAADTERDSLQNLLVQMVETYAKASWDPERQTAAEQVQKVLKKYNVDVTRNYLEESNDIEQQNQELQASARLMKALQTLGAKDVVERLDAANNKVIELIRQRNDERAGQTLSALALARKKTDEEYRLLIAVLNASALLDDDEERYDELIKGLNEDIKYYRQYVVPKKKGEKEEPTPAPEPDEGGEEDTDPTPDPSPTMGGEL